MDKVKKNKYNFPKHATGTNNPIYEQYVENMYYEDDFDGPFSVDDRERTPIWKKNGRYDLYHTSYDNTDMHQDRHTVAQHFIDRTSRTHG